MPGPYRFRFSLWPTLAVVAGIALALALGNWQLGRGHEKAALQQKLKTADREPLIAMPAAAIRAEDVAWHRVEVRGRFEPKYAVFIDNRVLHGAVGYHVVMPLRIGDSERYVLVNRGWVAGTGSRSMLPQITTPSHAVTVAGLAMVPGKRYLELSTKVAEGNVWQNLTLERYREAVPIALQPVVIQQDNDLGDGLRREWAAPDLGTNMHYGYAFQWFALAAAILVFYLVTHVGKRTPQPH
ncbi:MAG: SURF1 family protein [Betaproteobacteria bacterium]|nr:SURF1 family protein [Betaproteobacteria bacterium]